ncbi:transcription factor TCP12, partial [Carica papaya]|uniref:transcription factor TCP12 n=1 Tax=Carica papaya TaxID=3649 RepID=UPI000B8C8ED8
MFPSSGNNSTYSPFPFTISASFAANQNPNSTHEENYPSPFFHFPSSFLDDDNEFLMNQLLPQQRILSSAPCNLVSDYNSTHEVNNNNSTTVASTGRKSTKNVTSSGKKRSSKGGNGNGAAKQMVPRKRNGKKDRHSKIYTAQGPRDRRMRLSLQIARKFFDLQDMLGFDKASKTIEWLFSKSKSAIKELTEISMPRGKNTTAYSGGGKSASSTSESEVVSGGIIFKDSTYKEINGQDEGDIAVNESFMGVINPKGAKNKKSCHKAPGSNNLARESRDKARARARERTMEKMKMKGALDPNYIKQCSDHEAGNPNEFEHLASSKELKSSGKAVIEEEDQEVQEPSLHLLQHQMDSVGIIEKFLGIMNSDSSTVDSREANYPDYTGNWMINRDVSTLCESIKRSSSTGNVVQVQNPSSIFMINPDAQEENTTSFFMTNSAMKGRNQHSSIFSNAHDQRNPSSIFISTSSIGLMGSHLSCSSDA